MLSLLLLLAGVPAGVSQTPAPPLQHPLDPAGDLVLDSKGQPAEGSLPVAFVRSPDSAGPDSGGRYLVVVNSGYGVQFTGHGNAGQQLLQVIDLMAQPAPIVVQSVLLSLARERERRAGLRHAGHRLTDRGRSTRRAVSAIGSGR